jgi:hypothetical protein
MQVIIIEKATSKVVAQVPVTLGGIDYTPSEAEWFDEGWRAAVEDNLVNANERAKYRFEFNSRPA